MEKLAELISLKKIVIWDFDGTIVSLEIDWGGLKKELSALMSESVDEKEPLHVLIEALMLQGKRAEAFALISKYEHSSRYTPNTRVVDFIKNHQGPAQFVIVSDNLKATIEKALKELGIADAFVHIISKEDVDTFKPSVEGLRAIGRKFDVVRKDEYICIGDSWKDEAMSNKFGISFFNVRMLSY